MFPLDKVYNGNQKYISIVIVLHRFYIIKTVFLLKTWFGNNKNLEARGR